MPTVREVVTRFSFETDKRGVREVDQTMSRMTSGARTLARLFGLSLGVGAVRAMFRLGQSTTQARFDLQRMAGTDFSAFRRVLGDVRADLNEIRAGAGQVIRQRDFDTAAAGFVRVFGRGRRELDAFREVFGFAARQSAITGQNVAELVQQIQQAATSGDFSALLDLPGFDEVARRRLEDIQRAIDPQEIGGRAGIQQRMRALLSVFREFGGEQERALRNVPSNLLEANRAAQRTQDSMDKLTETLNRLLIPALEKINELLDRFSSRAIDAGGITEGLRQLPGITRTFSEEGIQERRQQQVNALRSGNVRPGVRFAPDVVEEARRLGPLPGAERSITFQNTFNVSGVTDGRQVAKEAARELQRQMDTAESRMIPTEDR